MSIWKLFRNWHEKQIQGFKHAVELEDYHMYWLAFGEGVVIRLLFLWLI